MSLGDALSAELRAALRDPATAAELANALRPALREELREALAAHQADQHLDLHALAEYVGCSYAAIKSRLASDPELQALRLGRGRLTRFRRTDVDHWMATRTPQRRRGRED